MQETTLEKIKKISINLFNEKSYEGTSLKDIFNLIGISAPSFYYYYSSKKDLYIELLKDAEDVHQKSFMDTLIKHKEETGKKQLQELIRSYWLFKIQNPEIAHFVARNTLFPPFEFRDEIWELLKGYYLKYYNHVLEVIKIGIDQNEISKNINPEYIAKMFFQMLIGSYLNMSQSSEMSIDERVEMNLKVMFEGINS